MLGDEMGLQEVLALLSSRAVGERICLQVLRKVPMAPRVGIAHGSIGGMAVRQNSATAAAVDGIHLAATSEGRDGGVNTTQLVRPGSQLQSQSEDRAEWQAETAGGVAAEQIH